MSYYSHVSVSADIRDRSTILLNGLSYLVIFSAGVSDGESGPGRYGGGATVYGTVTHALVRRRTTGFE